jgi:hypothetical protein
VPIFPQNADIKALSDEELDALLDELTDLANRVHAQDAELVGELPADEVVAEMERGVEAILAIRSEKRERDAAAQAAVDRLSELHAQASKEDEEEPEAPADDAKPEEVEVEVEVKNEETEEVVEAEPVLAAGRRVRLPAASPRHRPAAPQGASLVASAGLSRVRPGQRLDRAALAEALYEQHRLTVASSAEEKVIVASARAKYPDARALSLRDSEHETTEKIQGVVSPEAVVASGGLCAPVPVRYDIDVLGVDDTPVIDSLPGFGADRGGIRFYRPSTLASVSWTGIGTITAAQDAAGGTAGTKTCMRIPCPSPTQVDIEATFRCLEVGNLMARTFPEQLAAFNDLLLIQWARHRETRVLDAMKTGSTAVTAAAVAGAATTLLGHVVLAGAAMRNRHRLDPELRLRAVFPSWAVDLLITDLQRVYAPGDDRFTVTRGDVVAFLRSYGIEPTFYLDGATGDAQIFGAQSAGALLTWPTSVKWFLFPEGTWIHLDGGELDLGIVRDSTLNSTNDYRIFAEVFENVAMTGLESLYITSTVNPSGQAGGNATITIGPGATL